MATVIHCPPVSESEALGILKRKRCSWLWEEAQGVVIVVHSFQGSLEWWRSDEPYFGREIMTSPSNLTSIEDAVSSARSLSSFASLGTACPDGTYDLLVPKASQRRPSDNVYATVLSDPLPEGSLYSVRKNVYVCSPELLFLLAARRLSLIELIALGMELCGTYSYREDGDPREHDPITDRASIERYLKKMKGARGVKKACRALACVQDNSRSPRESDLYMMLCLPSRYGGFGLEKAELNRSLPIKGRLKAKTGMEQITPDLFWELFMLVVEYESDLWHQEADGWGVGVYDAPKRNRIATDSMRRRAYEALKCYVLTVTNDEFCDFAEVCRIARTLADRMGKHGLNEDGRVMWRRSDLHEWLKVPQGKRGPAPDA